MRILILGGDGYLGWPTAKYLSNDGHDVMCVDNYLRRDLMLKNQLLPLYDVPTLELRAKLWSSDYGQTIKTAIGDLDNWQFIESVFKNFQPEVIIHYAEQPSAPFSMMNRESAKLTLMNNIGVTANVIFAVKEFAPTAHIIKLGTMGEYGTPNIDIEEGWLDVEHRGRSHKFLYPRQAGSLYHTTKIMDTDLLWYYVRVWGLFVTDLMQGPVYGIFTNELPENKNLGTFLSYDEIFGTVLNRFMVQAVSETPLTVYGKGGQTRGYLNIKDTLQCIGLAVNNPPQKGELRIFNQFTEVFSVNSLASIVKESANSIGLKVEIQNIKNPRIEQENHYYNPKNTSLLDLGLEPNYLTKDVIVEMLERIIEFKNSINPEIIFKGIKW